jgi:hypothetical protein
MIGVKLSSSFRDPSGFCFFKDGSVYRQINKSYRDNYDYLINCGLYKALVDNGLLITHEEVDIGYTDAYKVIRPQPIPFISYSYEWCFSQLKDAALTTLKIQKIALEFGMSLKDCSAYNIQFLKGKPIFIDTLSFERCRKGQPWVAYKQFCQHFLATLALMSYVDVRLNQLLRVYIDGIPLDLTSSILPFRTHLSFPLFSHIHLHAKSQRYFSNRAVNTKKYRVSNLGLLAIVDNLESVIKNLKGKFQTNEWADYYGSANYSSGALNHKKQLVSEFLNRVNPATAWDLGANIGLFSRIASDKGIRTISFDSDPAMVERNYVESVKAAQANILPLLVDLTNPSPGIGWANQERFSLIQRGPADAVLALALIHHLAISNNVPFISLAEFFKETCKSLIIEFIPKSDSQAQRLLSRREDSLPDYTQEVFESEFKKYFIIQDSVKISDSERILYLMQKNKF